jgi:hypothetical protein
MKYRNLYFHRGKRANEATHKKRNLSGSVSGGGSFLPPLSSVPPNDEKAIASSSSSATVFFSLFSGVVVHVFAVAVCLPRSSFLPA